MLTGYQLKGRGSPHYKSNFSAGFAIFNHRTQKLNSVKREEVVKGGLLKVHAKFAQNQIVFINIYTSMVGRGDYASLKTLGIHFPCIAQPSDQGRWVFIVHSMEIQMETIWRLIPFLSKTLSCLSHVNDEWKDFNLQLNNAI